MKRVQIQIISWWQQYSHSRCLVREPWGSWSIKMKPTWLIKVTVFKCTVVTEVVTAWPSGSALYSPCMTCVQYLYQFSSVPLMVYYEMLLYHFKCMFKCAEIPNSTFTRPFKIDKISHLPYYCSIFHTLTTEWNMDWIILTKRRSFVNVDTLWILNSKTVRNCAGI